MKKRAVFLDRDGVLNQAIVKDGKPYPPSGIAAVEIPPDAIEAVQRLKDAGFLLIVVSNQPDVRRGATPRPTVEAINSYLAQRMPIDRFSICYHDSGDGCECRKPAPGMLLDAAREFDIDLASSYMIGDRWKDIEAGQRAGCRTIFINHGYAERQPERPDYEVRSLSAAAACILKPAQETTGRLSMPVKPLSELKVKIFADGAVKSEMVAMYRNPLIRGFTTNPTLMRKAGINNYKAFGLDVLQVIRDRPISFEVFSDELEEMKRQALLIRDWGENVYVKIPVTNTRNESTTQLVHELSREEVKLNITAMTTFDQIAQMNKALQGGAPAFLSLFAGRVADTGRDPVPVMSAAVELLRKHPGQELIWASPRELLNVFQADEIGCHVITVTMDILKKLPLIGKDLNEFSLETVKMFRDDALRAGYQLEPLNVLAGCTEN